VPELQHLFDTPPTLAQAASERTATKGSNVGLTTEEQTAESQQPRGDDEVGKHIDDVINGHWGSIDDRFKLPADDK
jgi:hypothetical protein